MKISFDFSKLKHRQCPVIDCIGLLEQSKNKAEMTCNICKFWMWSKKFHSMRKGRDSDAYKNKVKKFERINKFKESKKKSFLEYKLAQEKEREYNRKKIIREQTI